MASNMYMFANVNLVPGQYDEWQAAYDHLAKYVWSQEQTTKTYYFGIPFDYANDISQTTLMFAFEVYENMAGLTDIHLKSSTMQTFLQKALPCMTTGLDLAYYSYVTGFLDRYGDKRECGVMHDMTIHCTSSEARFSVEQALRSISQTLGNNTELYSSDIDEGVNGTKDSRGTNGLNGHGNEQNGNDGIYTWLVCRSDDDDKEIRLFSRFKTSVDLERYMRLPAIKAFWKKHGLKDVATMKQRGYVPNHKGWLHR